MTPHERMALAGIRLAEAWVEFWEAIRALEEQNRREKASGA